MITKQKRIVVNEDNYKWNIVKKAKIYENNMSIGLGR